jgi:hypothetical protein
MPQRLTLFSGEQATEASLIPLSGGIWRTNRIPYTELGCCGILVTVAMGMA